MQNNCKKIWIIKKKAVYLHSEFKPTFNNNIFKTQQKQ